MRVGQVDKPQLSRLGDKVERDHWGHLRKLIPHYETFWQTYVYPLRSKGSIWFRRAVDSDLETIAIASYSTYAALARARQKIHSDHEQYRYVEELYAHLQRSAEIGVKLIHSFNSFYAAVTRRRSSLSTQPLEAFIDDRLKAYRNLLHDPMLSMPKDERGRRLVPKPGCLASRKAWTSVMYSFSREDFVVASLQLKDDYRATCSHLEEAWKMMCGLSSELTQKAEFQGALAKGFDCPELLAVPPTSGAFFIGASSAVAQPGTTFVLPNKA
jgi:hypothetical protein